MTASLPPLDQCRIAVVGTSGSGKTTLARALSVQLGLPHVELDTLHWLPDWQARPDTELRELVRDATSGPAWIVDGNYRNKVQDLVIRRANVFVWLNYSRFVVMRRVVWRTLVRALTRQRLFSGNREQLRTVLFSRNSIIWWAWTTHETNRRAYRLVSGSMPQHILRVEHTTPEETRRWLEQMPPAANECPAASRC